MKNALVLGGLGAGLFAGTIVLLLGLQGRLNHEGMKDIPLVGALFPAPPAPAEPDPHAGEAAAPGPETAASGPSGIGLKAERRLPYGVGESILKPRPAAAAGNGEGGGEGGAAQAPEGGEAGKGAADSEANQFQHKVEDLLGQGQYRRGRLFDFPRLESGIGVDELNEMLRRAREAQLAAEQERAALQRQAAGLAVREADVRDRYEAVARMMQEVETKRAELEAKIEAFNDQVILIQPADETALKGAARSLASLEPQVARDVLLTMWNENQEGKTRVLKLLSVMTAEASDAVLATMDPGQIREFIEKRLNVLRATPVKK